MKNANKTLYMCAATATLNRTAHSLVHESAERDEPQSRASENIPFWNARKVKLRACLIYSTAAQLQCWLKQNVFAFHKAALICVGQAPTFFQVVSSSSSG